eukprot:gene16713-biopygen20310
MARLLDTRGVGRGAATPPSALAAQCGPSGSRSLFWPSDDDQVTKLPDPPPPTPTSIHAPWSLPWLKGSLPWEKRLCPRPVRVRFFKFHRAPRVRSASDLRTLPFLPG